MNARTPWWFRFAGMAALLLAAGGRPLQAQPVRPVSVAAPDLAGGPASTGNAASGGARFSRDGRFLVFTSAASDLAPRDVNGSRSDVFVRELATGRIELVSATPDGMAGDGDSDAPAISADGRRVVFVSRAANLVPGDTNGLADVFVRDRVDGTTRRVSVATDGTAADGESFAPALTPDGRWVCFGSRAANLVAGAADDEGRVDVFVHDLQTGETREASAGARAGTEWDVSDYALSDDGRWVAFVTASTNVVVAPPEGVATTGYVRDLQTGTAFRLGLDPGLTPRPRGPLEVREMAFAPNRPRLAISAWSTLSNTTQTNVVQIVDFDSGEPAIVMAQAGANGSRADDPAPVAFGGTGDVLVFAQPVVPGEPQVVRVWRAGSGLETPLDPNLRRGYRAREVAISPDGRRVAWVGAAAELVPRETAAEAFNVFLKELPEAPLRLVTANASGQPAGRTEPGMPVFSPDGRWLAFQSAAGLVPGDRNGVEDLWLFEVETLALRPASVPASPSATPSGASSLLARGLSADGRRVLFSSLSGDLVSGDGAGVPDLFVRDVVSGRTWLVTVPGAPDGPTQPGFGEAVLSANGRFVAFTAETVVVRADGVKVATPQVFLRDLELGRTRTVAVGPDGVPVTMRFAGGLQVSADGRYVAFVSDATTLVEGGSSRGQGVLRDLVEERNHLVAPVVSAVGSNPRSFELSLAGLGGRVLMNSWGAVEARMTLLDPVTGTREAWTGVPGTTTALSYDGRRRVMVEPGPGGEAPEPGPRIRWRDTGDADWRTVVPQSEPGLTNQLETLSRDGRHVVVRQRALAPGENRRSTLVVNLETSELTALEVVDDGGWSEAPDSRWVSLSADGRRAAFESTSSDLVAADPNRASDVFLRDLVAGRTTRVPRLADGAWEDAGARRPLLAADGRRVVFDSWAAGFLADDGNGAPDVFAVELAALAPADADQDGLDDLWERAWFGNLDRTGAGDWDGDGADDRAEASAGTTPLDALSVFRVGAVRGEGGTWSLVWGTVPGRVYRVESSEAPGGGWSAEGASSVGDGNEVRVAIPGPGEGGRRFYRVRVESAP